MSLLKTDTRPRQKKLCPDYKHGWKWMETGMDFVNHASVFIQQIGLFCQCWFSINRATCEVIWSKLAHWFLTEYHLITPYLEKMFKVGSFQIKEEIFILFQWKYQTISCSQFSRFAFPFLTSNCEWVDCIICNKLMNAWWTYISKIIFSCGWLFCCGASELNITNKIEENKQTKYYLHTGLAFSDLFVKALIRHWKGWNIIQIS